VFRHAKTFRVTTAMAIGGLVLGPIQPVQAQPTPASADPPARVGRLADLSGTVSFHTAEETQWSAATLNYPITGGNSVWTEPQASAVLDLGGGGMTLDQASQVDIDALDTRTVTATEKQGDVYLRVRSVVPGETYTVVTPRGSVVITQPGRYGIVAGDTQTPTSVTVIDGAAHVTGVNVDLQVQAHQTASITGADTFDGTVGPEADGPFLAAQLRAEQPRVARRAPPAPRPSAPQLTQSMPALTRSPEPDPEVAAYEPPPVVQQMTGAEELQDAGTWSEVPQYGRVWYPPVEQGYVPYRHGHWAFVAPWGWTWVDEARWGFAPFHYGRWVEVRDRWGWTPVAEGCDYEQPPVYSPALVSFVDPGAVWAGAAIGLAVGLAIGGEHRRDGRYGRDVGWVPLGYREPYYPPYRASPDYVSRINSPNVTHVEITRVANNYTTNNYYGAPTTAGRAAIQLPRFANAGAATAVPGVVMANSAPIAPVARPLTPQQLVAARPIPQVPLAPTARTIGITPVVAQRYQIPPSQLAQQQAVRTVPGPAVTPRPFLPAQSRPAIGAAALGAGVLGAGALGAAVLAARPPLPPAGGFRAQPSSGRPAPLATPAVVPSAVGVPGRPTPALSNVAPAPARLGAPSLPVAPGPVTTPRATTPTLPSPALTLPALPKAAPAPARLGVPSVPVAPGPATAPRATMPAAPGVTAVARPATPPLTVTPPLTGRPNVAAPLAPPAPAQTLAAPGPLAPRPTLPTIAPHLSAPPAAAPTALPRPTPPVPPTAPRPAPPILQAAPRPAPLVPQPVPRVAPPIQQSAPVTPRFTPPVQQAAPIPTVQQPAPRFTPPAQQPAPPPVRYTPPAPPPPMHFAAPAAPPPRPPPASQPPPQPARRACPPGHPVC